MKSKKKEMKKSKFKITLKFPQKKKKKTIRSFFSPSYLMYILHNIILYYSNNSQYYTNR